MRHNKAAKAGATVTFGHKAEVQIQKKSYTTSHLEH